LLGIVIGQALLLGQLMLLNLCGILWPIPAANVHWRREPVLRRQFGADYDPYCRAVRAWWPRLRPYG